ncbi:LLM class flavin-dependent oxidoreductase [Mycobacterium sp.]|uniref:LLM class flavin-dependent oxidoreductase n=1 Tax=Mycobacterium sp. TaxID=1785 RepID=UPI00333F9BD7
MLQLPGFGAKRPIDVPILIGAGGPKGLEVAAELGDGVFSAALPQPDAADVTDWRALLSFGTVARRGRGPELAAGHRRRRACRGGAVSRQR